MPDSTQFSILRQLRASGSSPVEERVVLQHAMMADVPQQSVRIDALDEHTDALRARATVPVGSVAFVRAAMALAGIEEPSNLSYPEVLRPWLRRKVELRRAGSILGQWFIKPTETKQFTGLVIDILGNPEHLSFYDRAQYNAFMALPPDTLVWVSEPVTWLSEFRYYVLDGKICGAGRYDDGPDDAPEPDEHQVAEMVALIAAEPDAPAAFSLDVGALASGETALVECNDAWSFGFYRGTLSHGDYVAMLWRRWEQLAGQARVTETARHAPTGCARPQATT